MSREPLRVLLVGHGRMGSLVERLAPEYGVTIVGVLTRATPLESVSIDGADVAIDFSAADAVVTNAPQLAARGLSQVIGTTGWHDQEAQIRRATAEYATGIIAAPNFAIGVNAFAAVSERAATLLAGREFAPWIHEAHHAAKKDAPSGTAVILQRLVQEAMGQPVDVSSTRAGHIPGTHTVGFDAAAETIMLTHTARDRTPFARGALEAAHWIRGRHGWFTVRDMLGI